MITSKMMIALIFTSWFLTQVVQPLSQADADLSALLRIAAELPIVVGTVWLFLRLANLHLETVERLMIGFAEREERQREHHMQVLSKFAAAMDDKTTK